MAKMCNNCGYPLQGNEQVCPECGNIIEQPQPVYEPQPQQAAAQPTDPMPVYVVATPPKTDWANYIYECSVIFWRTATSNFFRCEGRASRREFWSYYFFFWFLAWPIFTAFAGVLCLILKQEGIIISALLVLALFISMLCIGIRRLHDINYSGWWSLVPFVFFLMCLKKSDEGPNEYGYPEPASDILNN